MTTEQVPAVAAFDYGDLDSPDAVALESAADQIRQITDQVRRVGAEGVIRIGKILKEQHDKLAGKGRDGLFRPWVKAECGFSVKRAYQAIAALDVFGKCEDSTHLFDKEALYVLSADSTPGEATAEAIRLAKKGEHVTHKLAKGLKEKYSPTDDDDEDPDDDFEPAGESEFLVMEREAKEVIRSLFSDWPQNIREAISGLLEALTNEDHAKW